MMTVIRNIDKELTNNAEENLSPFAVYPNEELKRLEVGAPGHIFITDIDKLILLVLNKYQVLTSSLMMVALTNLGLENAEQKDIQRRLKLLVSSNFVTKAQFETPNGRAAAKCYMLGYRGRGYLKSIAQQVKLTGYIAGIDHIQCKKILAVNQYLIRTEQEQSKVEVCLPIYVPSKTEEKSSLIFRPQATLFDDHTVFIEAVRSDDTELAYLLEKLDRMEKVLRRKDHNVEISNPEVILVCENQNHMKMVMKAIAEKKYHFDLKFTSDTLIYSEPQHCMFSISMPRTFFSFAKKIACF